MAISTVKSDMKILNNFTAGSNTNALSAKIEQTDGLIIFDLELYNDAYTAGNEFVVGSVPSAYAPKSNRYFCGVATNSSYIVQNNFVLTVKTNGQISAKINGTTGRYLFVHGVYAINN